MSSGPALRRTRIAVVLLGVLGSLVFAVPSGTADTTVGACMRNRCVYDIELQAETRLPGMGTFGLTARFPKAKVGQSQNPANPASNPINLSMGGGEGKRLTGTVIGAIAVSAAGCVHERTYTASARAIFHAGIPVRRRAGASLQLDLAPTTDPPPKWQCPLFQQQNLTLAAMMFAVGNQVEPLKSPGATGYLSVGQDSSIGKASLAAVYGFRTKRPQASESSLTSPWRELWAGRSVVIRQRAVWRHGAGSAVTDVRLRFIRR